MSKSKVLARARRLLREPLLHFLLIGIALFVVYGKVAAPDRAGTRIAVSQAMVDEMAREHQARWSRAPSDQELVGLVETYVRDEILYREGLSLGLDRDDPVIKRRVRQKFEVITEEQNARDVPTDADLIAYMTKNAARFLRPATVSFEQVFFNGAATPPDVERAVAAARVAIVRGADPSTLGRATMLPPRVENTAMDFIARDSVLPSPNELTRLPIARVERPRDLRLRHPPGARDGSAPRRRCLR